MVEGRLAESIYTEMMDKQRAWLDKKKHRVGRLAFMPSVHICSVYLFIFVHATMSSKSYSPEGVLFRPGSLTYVRQRTQLVAAALYRGLRANTSVLLCTWIGDISRRR